MAVIDLTQTQQLIARAAAAIGSEYKLARALNVTDQEVSKWKAGQTQLRASGPGQTCRHCQ
jgi:DNA-binding transcriptional regulator YdaS (Cro superfamily)